jgi:hypothetical protein
LNLRIRAQEASVRNNAHTVQLAAEDFAAQNNGIYPAHSAEDLGFGCLIDLLPQGQRLANPFSQVADSPADGIPADQGLIGYLGQDLNGDGMTEGYLISGFGDQAVIITLCMGS